MFRIIAEAEGDGLELSPYPTPFPSPLPQQPQDYVILSVLFVVSFLFPSAFFAKSAGNLHTLHLCFFFVFNEIKVDVRFYIKFVLIFKIGAFVGLLCGCVWFG